MNMVTGMISMSSRVGGQVSVRRRATPATHNSGITSPPPAPPEGRHLQQRGMYTRRWASKAARGCNRRAVRTVTREAVRHGSVGHHEARALLIRRVGPCACIHSVVACRRRAVIDARIATFGVHAVSVWVVQDEALSGRTLWRHPPGCIFSRYIQTDLHHLHSYTGTSSCTKRWRGRPGDDADESRRRPRAQVCEGSIDGSPARCLRSRGGLRPPRRLEPVVGASLPGQCAGRGASALIDTGEQRALCEATARPSIGDQSLLPRTSPGVRSLSARLVRPQLRCLVPLSTAAAESWPSCSCARDRLAFLSVWPWIGWPRRPHFFFFHWRADLQHCGRGAAQA